jgi:cysteine desulfurase / selenocysteine lyase
MPIDLARARHETPGCEHVIHCNNAGAALMPQPVIDATVGHITLEARVGGYEAAAQAHGAVERFYDAAATLLGCRRQEVAFVENATRAWDMAFYSIPFQPGDRILTAKAEYASNYIAFLQRARQTGAVIDVIPNEASGQLSVSALREMMDERVKLIAITHVPTNGGLVNPAAEVGAVAREAGVLYLLDACQSIGQIPLDVNRIGCDMLSATGRKYLRGPRGTGLLYVRQEVLERLEPPFLDLHAAEWVADDTYEIIGDARRFENWETNYAGKVGLGVAIDYALGWGIAHIQERVVMLAERLRAQLSAIAGVTVQDLGRDKCGIVTFQVQDLSPFAIQHTLAERNINVSVAVLPHTRLDMEARHLADLVRASVHYYNSEDEIDQVVAAVSTIGKSG